MSDDNDDRGLLVPVGSDKPVTENVEDTTTETLPEVESKTQPVVAEVEAEVEVEAPDLSFVPDKFKDENGEVNLEKLVESYAQLEKGIIEKNIPEEYNEDNFEELGLAWGDGDDAVAWKEKVVTGFKSVSLSQEQFDSLMPLYAEALQSFAVMQGTPIDKAVEQQKFVRLYGGPEAAEKAVLEVSEYCQTLNEDIFKHPINQSAAGMALLHKIAKIRSGPGLVDSRIKGPDQIDLKAKAAEIVNDPAYGKNTALGNHLEAQLDLIAAQIERNKE